MTERLDALMTRSYQSNGETKTAYTKVGTAWPLSGGGFRLKLEAIPVPAIYENKVECSILLVPPREQGASQGNASGYSGGNGHQGSQRASVAPNFDSPSDDSEIPF